LARRAPGAKAEFTLRGPNDVAGEKIITVSVIVRLKDGSEKRGRGVGFFQLTSMEKMTHGALEEAFER